MVSRYFLDNDRLGKTNKVAKYQPAKWGIEAHKIYVKFFLQNTLKMRKYVIEIVNVNFGKFPINFVPIQFGPVTHPPPVESSYAK